MCDRREGGLIAVPSCLVFFTVVFFFLALNILSLKKQKEKGKKNLSAQGGKAPSGPLPVVPPGFRDFCIGLSCLPARVKGGGSN